MSDVRIRRCHGRRWTSWRLLLAPLIAAVALTLLAGTQGCKLLQQLKGALKNGGDVVISLRPGQPGDSGKGGLPATPGPTGPAQPESTPRLPTPQPAAPPSGPQARQPLPQVGLEEGVNELKTKHNIVVRSSYTARDIQQTLMSARQYKPEETAGLNISFSQTRRGSGVLGVWNQAGQSQIYGTALDVVYHEMSHHITLFGRNARTRQIGRQIVEAARQAGGGKIPASCITRSYATTNTSEFLAEFCTGMAALERGLPMSFTVRNGSFNPPESVRKVARPIFVN